MSVSMMSLVRPEVLVTSTRLLARNIKFMMLIVLSAQ